MGFSFHQREWCLRGYCILIKKRSNVPPASKCTFIFLFRSEFASFFIRPPLNSMMSFPRIQSFFAHLSIFYRCSHVFHISSFVPKINFLLYFQCQLIYCSCYKLDVITLIGQQDLKASFIVRGTCVVFLLLWCFIQTHACMFVRNNIARIKKYDRYQAVVILIFAHHTSTEILLLQQINKPSSRAEPICCLTSFWVRTEGRHFLLGYHVVLIKLSWPACSLTTSEL